MFFNKRIRTDKKAKKTLKRWAQESLVISFVFSAGIPVSDKTMEYRFDTPVRTTLFCSVGAIRYAPQKSATVSQRGTINGLEVFLQRDQRWAPVAHLSSTELQSLLGNIAKIQLDGFKKET